MRAERRDTPCRAGGAKGGQHRRRWVHLCDAAVGPSLGRRRGHEARDGLQQRRQRPSATHTWRVWFRRLPLLRRLPLHACTPQAISFSASVGGRGAAAARPAQPCSVLADTWRAHHPTAAWSAAAARAWSATSASPLSCILTGAARCPSPRAHPLSSIAMLKVCELVDQGRGLRTAPPHP